MHLKRLDSDDLYYREDILAEMDRHNAAFDFSDFYSDDVDEFIPNYTGFKIITGDREYSGYCYPYSMYHDDVLENVLFALYGDDYNRVYSETGYDIRSTSAELGAVFIQMLSKHYNLVWIPSSITRFQSDCILKFFDEMNEINRRHGNSINLGIGIKGDDGNFFDIEFNEVMNILPGLVYGGKVKR